MCVCVCVCAILSSDCMQHIFSWVPSSPLLHPLLPLPTLFFVSLPPPLLSSFPPPTSTSQALKLLEPADCLQWYPVSTVVNSIKHKSPECMRKIDPECVGGVLNACVVFFVCHCLLSTEYTRSHTHTSLLYPLVCTSLVYVLVPLDALCHTQTVESL